jgi:hypothetical protein
MLVVAAKAALRNSNDLLFALCPPLSALGFDQLQRNDVF